MNILVTGAVAGAGTGFFLSAPKEELTLHGNDLRRARVVP